MILGFNVCFSIDFGVNSFDDFHILLFDCLFVVNVDGIFHELRHHKLQV